MARKLIAVAALVALVSLASAGAALAVTYTIDLLSNGGDPYAWQEMYGSFPPKPGLALGQFKGGYPTLEGGSIWEIARLENTNAATDEDSDPNTWTYTVTYDAIKEGGGLGDGTVKFKLNYNGLVISSTIFTLTTHATYDVLPDYDRWVCHAGETIYGSGKNDLDGASFTFTGLLLQLDTYNSSGHWGTHIAEIDDPTNFVLRLEYTPVPLPAGIWLLGTGLLGLACLGRRRRK
jgi:hypothetical protein